MAGTKTDSSTVMTFAAVIMLIVLAVAIDNEAVGWLIGPIVLVMLIVLMSKVPLRTSLLTMMFCAITLENPAEIPASGQWRSPFFVVGGLLLNHLNTTTGVKPLFMSGMDILLGSLLLIALQRRFSGWKLDRVGRVPTPRPLIQLAFVSLAGAAFCWVGGLLRGGDLSMSLWQVDRVVYLPFVFLLFHWGLRGPADAVAVGRILVIGATVRAIAATIIIHSVYVKDDSGIVSILPYATTHHDSVLFADAFIIILSLLLNRVGGKRLRFAWVVAPILILGMISNHRRMVWVQVLLAFAVLYVVTPTNSIKRKLQKGLLMASPILLGYTAAGWNSESNLFKPVKILRSVVDAKTDGSTMWREIENFDLISTIKANPIFGTGYGFGYTEVVPLPAVDYELERFIPHNSILGLWCYCGYIGYVAITLLWAAGIYFAIRAYHGAQRPMDRAAALGCFGAILTYLVQCWGDLGLGSWLGVFSVGAAIATAGKMATAVGAWDDAKAKIASASARASARAPAQAR